MHSLSRAQLVVFPSSSCSGTSSTVVDDAHDAFHVYSLVWRADGMDVFVDGDLVHTVLRSEEGDWPFDKRFYLLLNVAVGGKWAGKHGVDPEAFPATMEVAYVRVYRAVSYTHLTLPTILLV